MAPDLRYDLEEEERKKGKDNEWDEKINKQEITNTTRHGARESQSINTAKHKTRLWKRILGHSLAVQTTTKLSLGDLARSVNFYESTIGCFDCSATRQAPAGWC